MFSSLKANGCSEASNSLSSVWPPEHSRGSSGSITTPEDGGGCRNAVAYSLLDGFRNTICDPTRRPQEDHSSGWKATLNFMHIYFKQAFLLRKFALPKTKCLSHQCKNMLDTENPLNSTSLAKHNDRSHWGISHPQ